MYKNDKVGKQQPKVLAILTDVYRKKQVVLGDPAQRLLELRRPGSRRKLHQTLQESQPTLKPRQVRPKKLH